MRLGRPRYTPMAPSLVNAVRSGHIKYDTADGHRSLNVQRMRESFIESLVPGNGSTGPWKQTGECRT